MAVAPAAPRAAAVPAAGAVPAALAAVPRPAAVLRRPRRAGLRADRRVLVAEKRWAGADLSITDEIQVVIAPQAALLLLNIDDDYYPGVATIVVHPTHWLSEPHRDRDRVLRRARLDGEAPQG